MVGDIQNRAQSGKPQGLAADILRVVGQLSDMSTPLSKQALMDLWSIVPEPDGVPARLDMARLVGRALGSKANDHNFLLNWAALEQRDGSPQVGAQLLNIVVPLLPLDDSDALARWLWCAGNIGARMGDFDEALMHLSALKQLAETHNLSLGVDFVVQAEVVEKRIQQATAD